MRALVVIAVLATAGTARADNQIWSALFVQARPGDTGITGWLDLHGRRREDGTLAIVRPGIGYTFGKALSAHVGYAYVPLVTDEGEDRREHRSWQQIIANHAIGSVKLQGRGRLEQRFGSGDDIGHRVRLLARGQWQPDAETNLQLVAWDELFLGLNETDWGTPQGFDQNRLFVGLGTDAKLKGVRVEAGYLNVVLRRDTQIDHALAVNLFVTFAP